MTDPSSHPHLRLLERGMAAFAAHDLATLEEIFDPDLVWHQGGQTSIAGDYHGIEEVFALLARRAAMTGDTYRNEVIGAIASDDFVTVLSRATAIIDGRTFTHGIASIYRIHHGKTVEVWHHPADPKGEAAFYG